MANICSCCHRELREGEPFLRNGIEIKVLNASSGEQVVKKYPIVCYTCNSLYPNKFMSLER